MVTRSPARRTARQAAASPQAGSAAIIASRQDSAAAPRSLRAVRIMVLRIPLSSRLTRDATAPRARRARSDSISAASARNAASSGSDRPSQASSSASVSGRESATNGSWTPRTSIVPSGARKVAPMKATSGRVSSAARRRAATCARATR